MENQNQNLQDLFPVSYVGTVQATGVAKAKQTENMIISFKDIHTRRTLKVVCKPDNPALNEAKALLQQICNVTISPFTTEDGVTLGTVSSGSISKALKKSDLKDYILMPAFDI